MRRPTELLPLTIIIPKLNDPHQEKKLDAAVHVDDEVIILKSTKQDYKKIIENASYDHILIINPNNYALLNNPENLDAFRIYDRFVLNNPDSKIRSSMKGLKEDILNCVKPGKITFRTLLTLMIKYYSEYEAEITQLENVHIPFD
jgi:hypothetical protein